MADILLLDDDIELLRTMETVLSEAGHVVWTASDGAEGEKLLASQEFDLVVTDIYMPGRDGLEIILDMRVRSPEIGIIGISGGGVLSSECLDLAKRAGAHHTLPKPFSVDEFLTAVGMVLHRDSSPI